MANPYDYLFFRIFKFGTKVSNWPLPAISTIIVLIMPLGINFLTIYRILLLQNVNVDFIKQMDHDLVSVILMALLFASHYFLFCRHRRYESIIKRYENESKKRQTIGTVFILTYYLGTFILVILVGSTPLPISK
jgi:hypothetical protein